jgi:hypothetical protein
MTEEYEKGEERRENEWEITKKIWKIRKSRKV